MKTKIFICFIFVSFGTFGQIKTFIKKYPFVHQTGVNVSLGRDRTFQNYYYYKVASYSSYYPQPRNGPSILANIGIETFNGLQIKKKTAAGIVLGVDTYSQGLIVPISASLRQTLLQKGEKGAKLQASIDGGYGFLGQSSVDSTLTNRGGLHMHPKLSFVFTGKNGSAFMVNFGYKYQKSSSEQIFLENSENKTKNEYINRRFTVGLGFQF